MSDEQPLTGMTVQFVVPHTPESVGFDSGRQFLSLAAYHDHYCSIVSELGANTELVYLSDCAPPEWDADYDIATASVTVGSSYGTEFSVPLYRSLARANADIVHVHGYNQLNALPVLGALAVADTTVVVQNHGSALDFSAVKHRAWYVLLRYVLQFAVDVVVSVNRSELDNLERAGVDPQKLVHLPNAVDTDLFWPLDQTECQTDLSMDPDVDHLLFVGKINENKGVSYLVKAMARLPENVHLTLVYSNADEKELDRINSLIAEHGLRERVDFVGEVEQERLVKYYNAADICVFPSVNEGFGVVTLESMACGTPVVATTEHASGGHLEHVENALVADKRSVSSLVENVERLLDSPAFRERLSDQGRETVRERYTWDQIGAELADIYLGAQ